MEQHLLQWHPAFQAALQIELESEQDALRYEREYNLTEKPLQIDTLIIKIKPGYKVRRSIGRIFRQYNVIEYKSPDDYISINDFFKVIGYASLLQSNTEREQEIPPEEITITLASSRYPRKLIRFLQTVYQTEITVGESGIQYLSGLMFPVQILHLPVLDKAEYRWLSSLRSNLNTEDVACLTEIYHRKRKNPMYDAVMNLIIRANPEKYREGKEMCEAFHELYADEFREIDQAYAEKSRELEAVNKALEAANKALEKREKAFKEQSEELKMLKKQIKELEAKIR